MHARHPKRSHAPACHLTPRFDARREAPVFRFQRDFRAQHESIAVRLSKVGVASVTTVNLSEQPHAPSKE